MPQWDAEIVVDAPLAAALVAEQFPELADEPVIALGAGWDYTAYRVGPRWVFRFPRREVVLPGMAREIATLPRIAALLPVAVPAARFVGSGGEAFPWPFFGAPFVPGLEPADAGLDDEARAGLARPLARFLRALHGAEVLAVAGEVLPDDPIGRGDMAKRVPWARAALAEVGVEAEAVLTVAQRLERPAPTAVCHGDLQVRQILVADRTLSGVIDWVDVCRGEPAIDLSLFWSLVPPDARDAFLDEYGAVTEESLLRARVLALGLNATLAHYAQATGMPALEREARAGVRRAASP